MYDKPLESLFCGLMVLYAFWLATAFLLLISLDPGLVTLLILEGFSDWSSFLLD